MTVRRKVGEGTTVHERNVEAAIARVPHMQLHWGWLVALTTTMFLVLIAGGVMLWRITRFN